MHRRSHIASVLHQAVWTLGFTGIPAASEIEPKQRKSARQSFRNTNKVNVRSGQAMQGNYGRAAARPVTESEFHPVAWHTALRPTSDPEDVFVGSHGLHSNQRRPANLLSAKASHSRRFRAENYSHSVKGPAADDDYFFVQPRGTLKIHF